MTVCLGVVGLGPCHRRYHVLWCSRNFKLKIVQCWLRMVHLPLVVGFTETLVTQAGLGTLLGRGHCGGICVPRASPSHSSELH